MNVYSISAAVLLFAVTFLLTRKIPRLDPWQLCGSLGDILMLPIAGAYILMLLTGAWVFRLADFCGQRNMHNLPARLSPAASASEVVA